MNIKHIVAEEVDKILHEAENEKTLAAVDDLLMKHAREIISRVTKLAGGQPGSSEDKILAALLRKGAEGINEAERGPASSDVVKSMEDPDAPEGSAIAAKVRKGVGGAVGAIPAGDEMAAAYFASIDKDPATQLPIHLKLRVLMAAVYVINPMDLSSFFDWINPLVSLIDDWGVAAFVLNSLKKTGFPKVEHTEDWENWKKSLKSKIGQREKPEEEEEEFKEDWLADITEQKIKKSQIYKMIREEIEVILSNDEAQEFFDLDMSALLDEMMIKRYLVEDRQSYPRGEEDDTDDVAKVIIFNENNEVLVLKRASHMKWSPGNWDLPGGMIKKEESAKQTVKREVKEETGLTIKNIIEVGNVNQITIFEANVDSDNKEIKLDDENEDHKWANPEEISEYDFVPFLKDFIGEQEQKGKK
tara:strand:- start:102 stop:1349 length:1248 start_codon:yes stop_codon:yes gene_type:complete